jgi:hypothetical protein
MSWFYRSVVGGRAMGTMRHACSFSGSNPTIGVRCSIADSATIFAASFPFRCRAGKR